LLWEKFPIKLTTEAMLTPIELRLYNQIKTLNARKLAANNSINPAIILERQSTAVQTSDLNF